ncbi:MAG: insulinase family protein [Deltaproteobacteria bacterium]|nr:insulinase family protein [Deltaproteobacteria bacterium]
MVGEKGSKSSVAAFLAVVIATLLMLSGCSSGAAGRSAVIPPPPEVDLDEYEQQAPQSWQLANGMTVYFLYDEEIPILRGTFYIPGGTLWEPQELPGALQVMGQQMRQGGAGELSADELDLELEKLAAAIGTEYGSEFGTISFSCLSSDAPRVLSLVADVVRNPRFQQDRLELWKGQAFESIKRRRDDPNTVASLAFKQLVYGDTPLGQVLVAEDVRRIDRIDLLRLHRQFVKPAGSALAITGKISRRELEEILEKNFSGWGGVSPALGELPEINMKAEPGVYFIQLPFSQSTVYLGHLGPQRLSSDHIAIEGFNTIFGGGDFGSRLMKRIRTELGLVYAIFGGVIPGFPVGQAVMVLQTKSESTAPAIVESLDVLSDMKDGVLDQAELEQARKSIKNSFIFRLDTPDDLVRRTVLLKLLKYPKDYDLTYLGKVSAMTPEEIKAVAQSRWHPDKMVAVVVGNETAYNALKEDILARPDKYPMGGLKRCTFDQRLRSCS